MIIECAYIKTNYSKKVYNVICIISEFEKARCKNMLQNKLL